jgi:hypothetical protein
MNFLSKQYYLFPLRLLYLTTLFTTTTTTTT